MKVHIALNVSSVEESVRFYRAMFGIDPMKFKPGYAKFDVAKPPLNLTLNQAAAVAERGALNHLGVQVTDTEEVLAARERLQKAGLTTRDEMNVDCCYAVQDKIWITDPDGNKWEVFTVKVADTQPSLTNTTSESLPTCCSA